MAFSDAMLIRTSPDMNAAVQKAATARGTTHSEWLRSAIRTLLALDGIPLAPDVPKDAGSLYDLAADGTRHWALVRDGDVLAMHRAAEKPTDEQGGTWLPVYYRDSEPFDPAQHWRLPPVFSVEADKVTRTYPIILKNWEHA